MMLPFLQLAHMLDIPQHMGWGGDVSVCSLQEPPVIR